MTRTFTRHTDGSTVFANDINELQVAVEQMSVMAKPGVIVAANGAPSAWINAADYLCNGVADNVAIQAALDANRGPVYLSPGTFNLAASVWFYRDYAALIGAGWDSILFIGNGMNLPAIKNTSPTGGYRYANRVENLKIDCNGANQTSYSGGLFLTSTYYFKLEHVQIWNPFQFGFWITRADAANNIWGAYTFIDHCHFFGGNPGNGTTRASTGIVTEYSDFNFFSNINIDWFNSIGGVGASLGGWNQKLVNVHIDVCETDLSLNNVGLNLFSNCSFDRPLLCAVKQIAGKGNKFSNCYIGPYLGGAANNNTLPAVDISAGATENSYEFTFTGLPSNWKYGVQEAVGVGANSYVACLTGNATFGTAATNFLGTAPRKAVCSANF